MKLIKVWSFFLTFLLIVQLLFSYQITMANETFLVRLYDINPMTIEKCAEKGITLIEAYSNFILIETDSSNLKWLREQSWYFTEEKDYLSLRFNGHLFYSNPNKELTMPAYLTIDGKSKSSEQLFLLQWIGPEKEDWKNTVEAYGIELIFPLHQYAWVCYSSMEMSKTVRALRFVRSWGPLPASSKIHKIFQQQLANSEETTNIQASVLNSFDLALFIKDSGLIEDQVLFQPSEPYAQIFIFDIPYVHLNTVANHSQIISIAPYHAYEPSNHRAARIVGTQRLNQGVNYPNIPGLDGTGEIAGVADTGIRSTHPDFWDPTFSDKVIATFPTNWDDYHSHGTHVAGTVAGTGASSPNKNLKGIAYNAKLVSQNFLGNQTYYASIGGLYSLFAEAYHAGARIHNNSWGINWNNNPLFPHYYGGNYDSSARDIDRFLWDHMDFTLVKSAGNNRVWSYIYGTYPFARGTKTISSDSNAKNLICVGALENENGTLGGLYTWRAPQQSLQRNIAYFSSTGPTHDNRIKPDVIAPGDPVESVNRNHLSSPFNPYRYMSGTSMSGPVVAGSATLIRQFYREYHQINSQAISSALVKASLINGSSQGWNDSDHPYYSGEALAIDPNPYTGFGKINVKESLMPHDKQILYVNAYDPLNHQLGLSNQNMMDTFFIRSSNSHIPLKATLVWTDFANTTIPPDAGPFDFHQRDLVNDLHLEILDLSSMTAFRGNMMKNGFSIANPYDFDHINNVEQIHLPFSNEGIYRIQVFTMDNITSDAAHHYRQPYALVMSGENIEWIDSSEVPSFLKPVQPMNFSSRLTCNGVELNWSAPLYAMQSPSYYKLTRRTWTGPQAGQQIVQHFDGSQLSWVDQSIQWGQEYYYMLSAYDVDGTLICHSPGIMAGWATPPSRPNLYTAKSENIVQLYWNRPKTGTCPIQEYHIYKSSDPNSNGLPIKMLTYDTQNFVDTSAQAGEDWYYRLLAIDSRGVKSLLSPPVRVSYPIIYEQVSLWLEPSKTELCPKEWLTVRVSVFNPGKTPLSNLKLILELPGEITFQRSENLRGRTLQNGYMEFDLPLLAAQQTNSYILNFQAIDKIAQEKVSALFFSVKIENRIIDQTILRLMLKKCQQGNPSPYLSIKLENLELDPVDGKRYLPLDRALAVDFSWQHMNAPFSVVMDWGNGQIEEITSLWENKTSLNHKYAQAGSYRCRIIITDAGKKSLQGEFSLLVRQK